MNWFNNASSQPTANIAPPAISEYMKHIYQAVYNHVLMKTSGALLVTGNWGSGKTYYFKNFLFPNLEKDTGTQSIIVSLYGVTDKDSIANKVLFAYLDNRAGNGKIISAASLTKGLQNLIDAVPYLKKHIDLNKLFKASGEDLFRFLPKEKLLICFDDLERMSEKIKPEDFMGLVNELVENKGYKVIIIANEKEIKDGIKFKEKTIEKTIHFKNDLSTIFDSITQNYDGTDFAQYLEINKEFILKSLDPSHSIKDKQDKLSTSFDNIRTIKFAIEHFRPAFEIINEKFTVNDELPSQQLKDIWLFVLAISIEFKEFNTISFKERRHLNDPDLSLSNDDLGKLIWGNAEEEDVQEENEWSFKEAFIKDYFTRINAKYIYFPQIFNLITAGVTIEKASFLDELEASYNVQDGVVKPAYQHLSRFMQGGYWNFADAEFVPALFQLLEYAETGQYDDLLSYINAGVYVLPFSDSLELTKDQIVEKLKAGIDITTQNISPSIAGEIQFKMATYGIEVNELKELREYILEKLDAKVKADLVAESQRLEEMFHNDLSAFVKEIYPKDLHIRSPEPLLFDSFNNEEFSGFIENWTPAAMMELASLVDVRYNSGAFAERLIGEIPFLKSLVEFLEENPLAEGKVLSNNIRTGHLVPALKKAITKLERHLPEPGANQNIAVAIEQE